MNASRWMPLLLALALVMALGWSSPANSQSAAVIDAISARASAVVTVRYVLDVSMGGGQREVDHEISCLLIDAQGLVLCTNTEAGGYVGKMAEVAGRGGRVVALPRDVSVLLAGDDGEALDAKLVARDSDRDLAWLQISELPEGIQLEPIDFAAGSEVRAGDRIYQLRLLDRFFGEQPIVSEITVAALIDKPRALILPTTAGSTYLGSPLFDANGQAIGLAVVQLPPGGRLGRMLGNSLPFANHNALDDMVGGVILTAAEIVKATALAREIIEADEQEEL